MHFQVKLETYTCPGLKKMYRVRVRGFKRNVLSETFVFVFGFRNLGGLGQAVGLGWAGLCVPGYWFGISSHRLNENSKQMKIQFEAQFTQFLFIPFLRV